MTEDDTDDGVEDREDEIDDRVDDLKDDEALESVLDAVDDCESVVDVSWSSSSSPAFSSASSWVLISGITSEGGGGPVRGPISLEISSKMLPIQLARPRASPARLFTTDKGLKNRFFLPALEHLLVVGGKTPPRSLIIFSVLSSIFLTSWTAWVLTAVEVMSLAQLRPPFTKSLMRPPN